jgi:ankyrin repeat protein
MIKDYNGVPDILAVDPKTRNTFLHENAHNLQYSVFSALIDNGVNTASTNIHGDTVVHTLIRNGGSSKSTNNKLDILVRNKANLDVANNTKQRPLHIAASQGNVLVLKFLLNHNVELDALDQEGQVTTPLEIIGDLLEIVYWCSQISLSI